MTFSRESRKPGCLDPAMRRQVMPVGAELQRTLRARRSLRRRGPCTVLRSHRTAARCRLDSRRPRDARPVSCTSNGIQSRSHDLGRGGGCGHEACRTMQSTTPPCVENMKQLMLPLGLLKCTVAASAVATTLTAHVATMTPSSARRRRVVRMPPRYGEGRSRSTFPSRWDAGKTFSRYVRYSCSRGLDGAGFRSDSVGNAPSTGTPEERVARRTEAARRRYVRRRIRRRPPTRCAFVFGFFSGRSRVLHRFASEVRPDVPVP